MQPSSSHTSRTRLPHALGGIRAVIHVDDAPLAAQAVAVRAPVARGAPVVHVRDGVAWTGSRESAPLFGKPHRLGLLLALTLRVEHMCCPASPLRMESTPIELELEGCPTVQHVETLNLKTLQQETLICTQEPTSAGPVLDAEAETGGGLAGRPAVDLD